jgi:hypothetical protein
VGVFAVTVKMCDPAFVKNPHLIPPPEYKGRR